MDTDNFTLEYGDPAVPSGNVLAYWKLTAVNDGEQVIKYVVSNFIVSPIMFNRNTVAATFPPVVFEEKQAFQDLARRGGLDIILVDEIEIPEEAFDFTSFFKEQLTRFNELVTGYSKQYAEWLQHKETPEISEVDEHDGLVKMNRLAEEVREAYLVKRNQELAKKTSLQIREIANKLNSPNYKYDIETLISILNIPDHTVDELSRLYFQKFFAIYLEQYEEAANLKQQIHDLLTRIKRKGSPPPEGI